MYCGHADQAASHDAEFRQRGEWRLASLAVPNPDLPVKLELSFWWGGAMRTVLYHWQTADKFQGAEVSQTFN
jgi:hypothetical protein